MSELQIEFIYCLLIGLLFSFSIALINIRRPSVIPWLAVSLAGVGLFTSVCFQRVPEITDYHAIDVKYKNISYNKRSHHIKFDVGDRSFSISPSAFSSLIYSDEIIEGLKKGEEAKIWFRDSEFETKQVRGFQSDHLFLPIEVGINADRPSVAFFIAILLFVVGGLAALIELIFPGFTFVYVGWTV